MTPTPRGSAQALRRRSWSKDEWPGTKLPRSSVRQLLRVLREADEVDIQKGGVVHDPLPPRVVVGRGIGPGVEGCEPVHTQALGHGVSHASLTAMVVRG